MANKVYLNPETAISWSDAGATNVLDLGGLAADAVRVGARHDLGATARASQYEWRLKIDGFDTAPVVGERIHVYLSTSDGTDEDGDVGTADAAGVTAALPNLHYLGSVKVQTTTAADNLVTSGKVKILSRYISVVVHNDTADALLSTADDHWFTLIPVPSELQ